MYSHGNPINQSFSNIKQAGKFQFHIYLLEYPRGLEPGPLIRWWCVAVATCSTFFFHSSPGCGSLWVRVFSFPLFAFFWGIFARIFRSFSIYNGVSNLKSVGLAVCRFDCSLHRCQLATVRLAAFQWNYRWCFRSPPP